MKYLVYEVDASSADIIEVTLDHAANVRLLDASNYASYRRGGRHRYVGGFYRSSPVRLRPPLGGRWYVVVDLGGFAGSVRAAVAVRRAA